MADLHKILYPLDFSECSRQLVGDVLNFAKKFNSEIHLVYVVRAFGYYSTIYVDLSSVNEIEESLKSGAKRSLLEFKEEFFGEYSQVSCTVLHGDASDEIVRFASDFNIDLIIMGTHGRKALEKLFLGSVAQRVVQSSAVPVLTINPYLRKQV